jgi:hypothetical protein
MAAAQCKIRTSVVAVRLDAVAVARNTVRDRSRPRPGALAAQSQNSYQWRCHRLTVALPSWPNPKPPVLPL